MGVLMQCRKGLVRCDEQVDEVNQIGNLDQQKDQVDNQPRREHGSASLKNKKEKSKDNM